MSPKQFRYMTVHRNLPLALDELNNYGERGWELAGVVTEASTGGSYTSYSYHYIFKQEA